MIRALCAAAGAVALIVGVGLVFVPAGVIVAGVLLMAFGLLTDDAS